MKNNIIIRLISAINSFGLNLGFRWWKIENFILRDPEFALWWADQCEEEASNDVDENMRRALVGWARCLRMQHREFKLQNDE